MEQKSPTPLQELEQKAYPVSGFKQLPGRFVSSIVIIGLFAGLAGGYLGAGLQGRTKIGLPGQDQIVNQKVVIAEDSAIVDVVKKASPAVVSIIISKDLSKVPGFGTNPFEFDPFAPFFGFGQQRAPSQDTPNVQQVGAGSGFFVSSDGLILTNKHVVSDEQASYTVLTNDRKKYEATVLARDPVNDLAILKVDVQGAPTLELTDSSKLDIGQRVIAIGNSLGQYANTVTTGVVSGIGRSIVAASSGETEQLEGVIQTDAAINPGNSGGPLLNTVGQVIGINTAVDREGQLVGFAIPANDASHAIETFRKGGKITRPYLGVRYVMITESLADGEKLPRNYGALVARGQNMTDLAIIPGSPADKADLVENDIILECDGKKLEQDLTLSACVKGKQVGDEVTLTVYHRGEEKTVKVKLEESK